ncbi:hypothetical protein Tsubulata_010615 [Turnera subulata]|uniref:RRM domain-containing protein n=1 Tax=Turnera subulata TaxID=218843 RepID=A0A9Q0F5U3_9ROSI|nr:hypothetical protein Tsubulata_010615 [Turnera subulata]
MIDHLKVTSVYVENLPTRWRTTDVHIVFSKFGVVADVFLPEKGAKFGRRFGFVRFQNTRDIVRIHSDINSTKVDGGPLKANVAKIVLKHKLLYPPKDQNPTPRHPDPLLRTSFVKYARGRMAMQPQLRITRQGSLGFLLMHRIWILRQLTFFVGRLRLAPDTEHRWRLDVASVYIQTSSSDKHSYSIAPLELIPSSYRDSPLKDALVISHFTMATGSTSDPSRAYSSTPCDVVLKAECINRLVEKRVASLLQNLKGRNKNNRKMKRITNRGSVFPQLSLNYNKLLSVYFGG